MSGVGTGVVAAQARVAQIVARFDGGPAAAGGFADVLQRAAGLTAGARPVAPPETPAAPAATPVGPLTVAHASPAPSVPGSVGAVPPAGGPVPTGTLSTVAHQLPAAARGWLGHVEQAARRNGVDPRLLAALVTQESAFRPDARSHAGAIGLTQLMPATAAELGVDPTDPVANLDGGARYLRQQLDRFGTPALALAAYNAGPGRVAAAGGVPAITETRSYVSNVLAHYTRLGGSA